MPEISAELRAEPERFRPKVRERIEQFVVGGARDSQLRA
jgi:hypothetical protein